MKTISLLLLLNMLLLSCSSVKYHTKTHTEVKALEDHNLEDVAKDLAALQDEIQNIYLADAKGTKPFGIKTSPAYVKVTGAEPLIYRGADFKAGVLTTASGGQDLEVVDKVGEWYAVSIDSPVQGIDSGWVNASQVVPTEGTTYVVGTSDGTAVESISFKNIMYRKIMNSVISFRKKYDDNPYIKVTGFSVDISIPPSVSIDFEFK